MNVFVKEYGSFLVYSLIAILLMGTLLFGIFSKQWGSIKVDDKSTDISAAFISPEAEPFPQLQVTDCRIIKGTSFDIYSIVRAQDELDGDITSRVKMQELSTGKSKLSILANGKYSFSTEQVGTSMIEVSVTNSKGNTQSDIVTIIVYSQKG